MYSPCMVRLPPLNALKSFESAARLRSFSRAADELSVTQSAVSHQIRQLETWLGVPLFDRSARNILPTPRAAEFARVLSDAFGAIAIASRRVTQAAEGTGLTIASIPSFATIWLIPRLQSFLRERPGIAVKVMYAFYGQPVDFSEIDIAILWGKGEWPGAHATRLMRGESAPVCSPAYQAAAGTVDLSTAALLHDTDHTGWAAWFKAAGLGSPALQQGPVFEDFNLMRSAALAGHGCALCPIDLIADDLSAGRLVQLSDRTILTDFGYFILERSAAASGSAAESFKAWLIAGVQKG